MARKTLEQMCAEAYDDPELARHVALRCREAGTEAHVLDGRSVLPDPNDAYHDRLRLETAALERQIADDGSRAVIARLLARFAVPVPKKE